MSSTNYLLRVMKYKGPQTSDTKVGLSTHSDKNVVTILYQNQVEGLQVMTKDGKWISYKPSSSSSFVVMIGDSLHVSSIHPSIINNNVVGARILITIEYILKTILLKFIIKDFV